MIIKGPRDNEKALDKLIATAPTSDDALALHRLLVGLRRDRHPTGGEVEQAALKMLVLARPALGTVSYHKMRKRVQTLSAQHAAKALLDEALAPRHLTLAEAVNIAFQKLA